jgi:hypothetical protein
VTRRFVRDLNGGTTFIGDKEEDVKIDESKYVRKEVKAGKEKTEQLTKAPLTF